MADESPADLIRRAAALMRQRAEAAAAGPWSANRHWIGTEEHWRINGPVMGRESALIAGGFNGGGVHTEGDARHIASWSPVEAHAGAGVLEAAATEMDDYGPDSNVRDVPLWTAAHELARAVLGEVAS